MLIFKICPQKMWDSAQKSGVFEGAAIDLTDGFIHFSAADQVRETASRHFIGQSDLVLVAIEAAALGPALRWEASRGGALFPHLYGPLPVSAATAVATLPLGADGNHVFPETPAFRDIGA